MMIVYQSAEVLAFHSSAKLENTYQNKAKSSRWLLKLIPA